MKNQVCEDVKVYQTLDYERFNKIAGNRAVNKHKVDRIIKAIQIDKINVLKYAPIIVDSDYNIIDGQHRLAVSRKLKREVYYVIMHKISVRDVARINSNTQNWSAGDFLECYAKLKVKSYIELKEFLAKYPFMRLGIAASLLQRGTLKSGGGVSSRNSFQDGEFEVRFLKVAEATAEHAKRILPYCEDMRRDLVRALNMLLRSEVYTQEKMFQKLKMYNLKVEVKSSYKDYLSHLEDLYNFRNSQRERIY